MNKPTLILKATSSTILSNPAVRPLRFEDHMLINCLMNYVPFSNGRVLLLCPVFGDALLRYVI